MSASTKRPVVARRVGQERSAIVAHRRPSSPIAERGPLSCGGEGLLKRRSQQTVYPDVRIWGRASVPGVRPGCQFCQVTLL